jgi:hypothetical protein
MIHTLTTSFLPPSKRWLDFVAIRKVKCHA